MSVYNVNDEIDSLVDIVFEKISKTLKEKLKKIILKSEKTILRQYVASQKETVKITTKNDNVVKSKTGVVKKKRTNKKLDYSSVSESDYSDSD
tara:strand:- start:317 stop:595 length:279 start_codon:yes stop_codon:yes gene_type:complete